MLDKLRAVENRYEELCFKMEQPDFYNDPKKAAALLREKNDMEPVVETYRAYNRALRGRAYPRVRRSPCEHAGAGGAQ